MSENPLYGWSAIADRPALVFPGGKRLAVIPHVSVERPEGVLRLMTLLDRFGLRPTAPLSSDLCERAPAIVAAGVERDWCWVGHGADNDTWLVGLEREAERAELARITDVIEQATGRRPRGWLGPGLTESRHANELLAGLGYRYTLGWGMDEQPVRTSIDGFLSLPYPPEVNDLATCVLHGQTGPELARLLVDQFDELLAEGSRVMSFGLHPYLTGRAHLAKHLAAALEHITAHADDVWFPTGDELADWYLEE